MSLIRERNAEPIPGYRLIELLGSGGFGDVWKCEAPGGLFKAIKFVNGNLNALDMEGVRAEQELKALQRVKEIRHPFIVSIERIEVIQGELVIVMELADKNLQDRLVECQQSAMPGIPREELLYYLRDAAEALDLMNRQHELQHLDIKPRNLFLVSNRVKVADFGLVKDLEGRTLSTPHSGPMGGVTPLYASPETFNGIISKHSDQYSLAIVYMEMLTGRRPFNGKTPRQLFLQHTREEPDLSPLPEAERPIVAKALSKNMQQRFPSCIDFIKALITGRMTTPAAAGTAARPSSDSRPTSSPGTLEDLFLGPIDPAQVFDSYQADSPEPLSPEDLTRLSVTVAQPLSGSLRPTLIIGLGSFGRQSVQALRTRIIDRFGSLEKLPLLRYLIIDTDHEALIEAQKGPPEQAMQASEVHHLPLQRVIDYRRTTPKDFDLAREWMSQEKWYAAPRSLETNGARGCRALGRLAFFFNFNRLAARLRNELKIASDPKNRDHSVSATGLAARCEAPQVYILAAAGGGTAGLLVDLSYTLRRQLQDLGHKEPDVTSWLMIGAPNDPATPAEEQANVYATLTEIRHFNDPTVEFSAQYAGNPMVLRDTGPPFQAVYLQKMGHRSPDGLKEIGARMAGYLFHDLTTPLGSRLTGSRLAQQMGQETPFRSFGTYSIWFPRGLLLRVAARTACERLLETWQTPREEAGWLEPIAQACDHRLSESRWRADQVQRRIEEAATTGMDGHPGQALTAFLATLEMQSTLAVALEDPAGWCRQALERVHEWVGSGISAVEETSEWRKSRLHRLFTTAVAKVADEYIDHLAQPAHEMFDQPDFRLAAADVAYTHLIHRCEERIGDHQAAIREQVRLTERASLQVDRAMEECLRTGGFSFFGRSAMKRSLRRFVETLAVYARQRLIDELCRSVQNFHKVLEGKVLDLQRDLLLCRKRLRDMRDSLIYDETPQEVELSNGYERERHAMAVAGNYSSAVLRDATVVLASRIVLPEGDNDLNVAALDFLEKIAPEHWYELDQYLQEHVLNPLGGLHQICMTRGDLTRALGAPLLEGTAEYLGRHLPITDVCEAEYSTASSLEIDLSAQMRAYYHLSTPSLGSSKPDRESGFLVLPNSEDGKKLAAVAKETLPGLQVIFVANQADLLFCREQAEITPADLQEILEPCKPSYEINTTSPLTTPHARCDILDWIPLEM